MLVGRTLLAGMTTYSPWFPKPNGMDDLLVGLSIQVAGGGSITVTVETKNPEDADSAATTKMTIGSKTTKTVHRGIATDLLQLVRYKYAVTGSGLEFIHFEMMAPSWLHDRP